MRLPLARGPVTAHVTDVLRTSPSAARVDPDLSLASVDAAVVDEDLQLALYVCYELHYRGWQGVDEDWEWDPGLLALRARLERAFEHDLRFRIGRLPNTPSDSIPAVLAELASQDHGPTLATYLQRQATMDQFREFVIHRSLYHLKEADPHSWGIPRLAGAVKAALVEIQADEYGGGRPERMHSELFRRTMRGLGLDDSYGHYLEYVPAITLATSNVISMFGLHRRLRGALAGHLAAFEMTSSLPNRRYGNGLRRLGATAAETDFYDVHVTADAVHEQIAAHDLCGALVSTEPELAEDVVFGARCALELDGLFAEHLMTRWRCGAFSLRSRPADLPLAG